MSVRPASPIEASVVTVNVLQLTATRFDTGTPPGSIGPEQLALVDDALRAVLDLQRPVGPLRCLYNRHAV